MRERECCDARAATETNWQRDGKTKPNQGKGREATAYCFVVGDQGYLALSDASHAMKGPNDPEGLTHWEVFSHKASKGYKDLHPNHIGILG